MTHEDAKEFTEKFTPSVCKPQKDKVSGAEIPAAYEGYIVMKVPSWDERMGLFESYGLDLDSDETKETLKDSLKGSGGMKFGRFLARDARHRIVEVKIKRLDDGFEFTSWSEVEHEADLSGAVMELAWKLIGKFSVGKNSAAP